MSKVSQIKRGKSNQPVRTLLYSVEGLGKSTFASQFDAPVFLGPEDGTSRLDVARFPDPTSWLDALESVRSLATDPHDHHTIVVDTVDWLEPFVWQHICARDKEPSIHGLEKGSKYGYGKGYKVALEEWRVLLSALDKLRTERGMHVVLLGHSMVKTYKNPTGEDYDRYWMKTNELAGGLLKEWCDVVLFGRYETFASKDDSGRAKGTGIGARVIHTEQRPAWDAKNRFHLPEQMPLDFATYWTAVNAESPAMIDALRADVATKLMAVPEEKRAAISAWLETPAAHNVDALRVALNRISTLAAQP